MSEVPPTNSISQQSDVDPGTYLLNAYSKEQLKNVSVTQYRLDVEGGVSGDRSSFTGSAAYWLDQEHGTPVSTAGKMRVVSATSLSQPVYVWGQRVEAVEEKKVTLSPENPRERETLRNFVQSCLRRAVPDKKYDYEFINEIVRREQNSLQRNLLPIRNTKSESRLRTLVLFSLISNQGILFGAE
ncbi:hypothetical protein [Halarchaeum acidiphilum]|uniref:hypothetical protein n=1 Tax=Halarchaeum acidiphilum TaxID=489138 RepID=UPI0019017729|nr:hypothetical protein [Halarchaeum acidiphilum]